MKGLQIEYWQAQAEQLKAQIITGMPRGSGRQESDEIEKAIEMIDKIVIEKAQYIMRYSYTIAAIENAVGDVRNPACRKVLSMHYLEGMDWKDVAQVMHYSEASVFRLHRKALSLFVIKSQDDSK
jgi:DNA-directed RNA polymerase specialized sigma24 family protein